MNEPTDKILKGVAALKAAYTALDDATKTLPMEESLAGQAVDLQSRVRTLISDAMEYSMDVERVKLIGALEQWNGVTKTDNAKQRRETVAYVESIISNMIRFAALTPEEIIGNA